MEKNVAQKEFSMNFQPLSAILTILLHLDISALFNCPS